MTEKINICRAFKYIFCTYSLGLFSRWRNVRLRSAPSHPHGWSVADLDFWFCAMLFALFYSVSLPAGSVRNMDTGLYPLQGFAVLASGQSKYWSQKRHSLGPFYLQSWRSCHLWLPDRCVCSLGIARRLRASE